MCAIPRSDLSVLQRRLSCVALWEFHAYLLKLIEKPFTFSFYRLQLLGCFVFRESSRMIGAICLRAPTALL